MTAEGMYREHILDLYKNPLNYGVLKNPTHKHKELNPLCGDEVTIQINIQDNIIKDIKFSGKGCAISMAASSLLTEYIKGKTVDEVLKITKDDLLEIMEIKVGVVRLKCALLCLEVTHKAILEDKNVRD